MPNEFIARNGLRAQNSSDITGSLKVAGKADEIQLLVKANSSQTANIVDVRDSSNTTQVQVLSDGTFQSLMQILPTGAPAHPSAGSVYFSQDSGDHGQLFIYNAGAGDWFHIDLMP